MTNKLNIPKFRCKMCIANPINTVEHFCPSLHRYVYVKCPKGCGRYFALENQRFSSMFAHGTSYTCGFCFGKFTQKFHIEELE